MTRVSFARCGEYLTAFTLSGHSMAAEYGSDIVCAAVSSAVYMAANTITEILKVEADITVEDGYFHLAVGHRDAQPCGAVMQGLKLHLSELARQYPDHITMNTEE